VRPFNGPRFVQAIRGLLDLQGDFGLQAEESVGFTVPLVSSLDDTPFLRYSTPWQRGLNALAGGGAAGAWMAFRPGADAVLQITRLTICGQGAADAVAIIQCTNAQFAALAVTASQFLVDVAPEMLSLRVRPSFVSYGNAGAPAGERLDTVNVAAAGTLVYDFKRPVMLYGRDPGGAGALVVQMATVGSAITAGGQGNEWLLPSRKSP